MKKTKNKIVIGMMLGASLMLSNRVSAQTDWHVAGNTGTSSANFVGTADDPAVLNAPLKFRTQNIERMRILGGLVGGATTGFVGIGTTAPTTRLDVNGKTRTTNFQMTSGAVNGRFLKCDASGNATWSAITVTEADPQVGSNLTSRIPRWNGTALVSTTNSIFDAGTGNIGIGTTTPAQKLHVVGNIKATGSLQLGSAEELSDGGANVIASNSDLVPISSNSRDLGSTAKKWNDVFAGNTVQLGAVANNFGLQTGDVSPNAGYLRFGDNTGWKFHIGRFRESSVAANNTTTTGVLLTIQDDGNVGLGTTTPTQKLDVAGNISGTNGDLYLGPGNGVLNAGGGLQNALINIIGDADQHSIVNGDEDLYIQGALEVGNVALRYGSSNWATTSDARLSTNVNPYQDGLSKLLQINPVTFNYNNKLSVDQNKQYVGVVAQDIQKIAPYMVEEQAFFSKTHENENGATVVDDPGQNYLIYDANALTYMLVNSVKEQNKMIESMKAEIAELKAAQGLSNSTSEKQSSTLGSYEMPKLEQNAPNPFSDETTIHYYLPSNSTAVLMVMSLDGKEMLSTPVTKTGYGEVRISGSTMAAGTYTYTLVVNGKAAESKIMVLTK